MKLMKYSWLAALPMIFTACQDDMLVEKHSQQGICHLTASMEKKGPETRAQIVLNGTSKEKESFHWNEGDQFVLYQLADDKNELSAHEFSISETYTNEKPAASADFSTLDALTQGREFAAFYPVCPADESGRVQMTIDMVLPDNTKESWVEYFQNNMFMKATGVVGETSAGTHVDFEQLCGLIRITYKNTSKVDRTFDAINVDGLWTNGGYCPLNALNTFYPNVAQKGNAYGITFEKRATVKAGTSEDFYILFLYNAVNGEESPMSTVSVVDIANDVTLKTPNYSKPLPVFKAGRSYWLNITDDGKELTWTNDVIDDGDEEPVVVEVNDITGLKDAMVNEMVTHIALKNPIVIDGEEQVYLTAINSKNISMSDDFTWTVNGQEYDALIVNRCPRLEIRNCTVSGSDTGSSTDKYLLASTDGTLFLDNMDLQANGNMNAVSLDNNKEFYLYGSSSSINVENDGKYAFKVNSSTTSSSVYLDEGTIEGNVDYIDNYSTEESRGWFVMERARLDGNITVGGDNVAYINIDIREGATYTGNKTAEVSSFVELKSLERNASKSEIKLKNPIIVDGEEEVYFVPNYPKNISMSDDFTWTVNGQEYDALIVNSCPRLEIRNFTILGSDTGSSTDKYLLASTDGTLFLDNMDLQANGNMNAVSLDNNKEFYLYGSTSSITVQNDGKYAFKVNSSTTSSTVYLDEGTIEGNVDYIDNYSTEESRGWFVLDRVKINGNLTVEGGNVQYLNIEIREGATCTGTGWDSWKTTNN